jgi:cation diffusion facilitator family transporter
MIYESFQHFFTARAIRYDEALTVAALGLVVNLVCAAILHRGDGEPATAEAPAHRHDETCNHGKNKLAPAGPRHHHDHAHHGEGHSHHGHVHDHNHESAYIHILTDALTSVLAIVALLLGRWQGLSWLDPLVGVLGGVVVLRWSLGLIRQSGMDLLDAHDLSVDRENLVKKLEGDGSQVVDIHLWKLAPGQVGCELIIRRNQEQGSAYYRDLIQRSFHIHHLVIEVI